MSIGLLLFPGHKLTSSLHLCSSGSHMVTEVNYAISFGGKHLNKADLSPAVLHLILKLDLSPRLRSQG